VQEAHATCLMGFLVGLGSVGSTIQRLTNYFGAQAVELRSELMTGNYLEKDQTSGKTSIGCDSRAALLKPICWGCNYRQVGNNVGVHEQKVELVGIPLRKTP
jgi:hypothetical protein